MIYKFLFYCFIILIFAPSVIFAQSSAATSTFPFFKPDHNFIQYTGRFDFTNRELPKVWAAGSYIKAKFTGTSCIIIINDEMLDNQHNYIQIVIDDKKTFRVRLNGMRNTITAEGGLTDSEHTITICKNTDPGTGYIQFVGLKCKALVSPDAKQLRKIEFVGGSTTSGAGSDISKIACSKGKWYDQHNAWLSYGAITARNLSAEWHITAANQMKSIAEINHSYSSISMSNNINQWSFENYQPHVIAILAEQKEITDSAAYCDAYIDLIQKVRTNNSKAEIICIYKPVVDAAQSFAIKNYISAIVDKVNNNGDSQVTAFYFFNAFNNGCYGNPDLTQHRQIASELSDYIRKLKGW